MVPLEDGSILLKGIRLFIDAVIGEMGVQILLKIARHIIWLRRKTNKAFVVDIDSEWVDGGDQNVDSEVELVAVDQEGI